MNRCFLTINLDGISEKASLPTRFFQKKALHRQDVRGPPEKSDFLEVSTGKIRFLSYLYMLLLFAPPKPKGPFLHEDH
jgi:hypothetical protein